MHACKYTCILPCVFMCMCVSMFLHMYAYLGEKCKGMNVCVGAFIYTMNMRVCIRMY